MKVQFRSNLGSVDAKTFGLDHKDCTAEAIVDVPNDVGEKLIDGGFAANADKLKAPAKTPEVTGVK